MKKIEIRMNADSIYETLTADEINISEGIIWFGDLVPDGPKFYDSADAAFTDSSTVFKNVEKKFVPKGAIKNWSDVLFVEGF